MPTLAVATILLNEEDFVEDMLKSARKVAREIVIGIDSRTTDRSGEIARRYGAKTFLFEWQDDFAAARNLTLDMVTSDWVLVIDADERLTDQGVAIIRDIMQRIDSLPYDGFNFMHAQSDLQGQVMSIATGSTRLFKNTPSHRYRGVVHEQVIVDNLCSASGVVSITHVGYAPSLWVSRGKHERNLRLLRKRLEIDPADEYARRKLAQELALDETGYVRAPGSEVGLMGIQIGPLGIQTIES